MSDEKETESIVQSIVPILDGGDKKAKYLSYRIANFPVMQACELAGCHFRSVRRWREEDPEFARLEGSGLTEVRKQLGNEFINLEFTRNYHLVLQKDFEILMKSARKQELTDKEQQYLLKLRNHYTPQHLSVIKQIVGEIDSGVEFDFTKLTLRIQRERQEIEILAEKKDELLPMQATNEDSMGR